jgi:hypothetical protein
MNNNNLLLLVLVVVIAVFLFFVVFGGMTSGCKLCPNACKDNQPTDQADYTSAFLDVLVKGCIHRLRGLVRADMMNPDEVKAFLMDGSNKLVVLSNLDPQDLVNSVQSGDDFKLNMVAVSSTRMDGKKRYIVMGYVNQRLTPVGAPTENLEEALNYFKSASKDRLGAESMNSNNLVFYIDEDLPCPTAPRKEECCGSGRRY